MMTIQSLYVHFEVVGCFKHVKNAYDFFLLKTANNVIFVNSELKSYNNQ
jgi:hypothetical protein